MVRKKIDKLSVTLARLLSARGMSGTLHEYRVHGRWEKIVGAAVARHAQPVSVRGKKLALVVDSPAWMQQLSLLKPVIIEKVNSVVGRETIRDITLKLGEVAPPGIPDEEPLPARAPLDAEDRLKIEGYVHGIEDSEIREALRRLIEKDFQSRKK